MPCHTFLSKINGYLTQPNKGWTVGYVVMSCDEPLLKAVQVIIENDFVLVRQKDKTISGIVTMTDIGEQFKSMAEPFLIIEQIENFIRKILDQKFTPDELKFSNQDFTNQKEIRKISDLTFGQYVRIIEDPKKFEKLKLKIDRVLLTNRLEDIRKIRNDVMHFNPDKISDTDMEKLRETLGFLQAITDIVN